MSHSRRRSGGRKSSKKEKAESSTAHDETRPVVRKVLTRFILDASSENERSQRPKTNQSDQIAVPSDYDNDQTDHIRLSTRWRMRSGSMSKTNQDCSSAVYSSSRTSSSSFSKARKGLRGPPARSWLHPRCSKRGLRPFNASHRPMGEPFSMIDKFCCRLIGSYLSDAVCGQRFQFHIGYLRFQCSTLPESIECTANLKMRCYELVDVETISDVLEEESQTYKTEINTMREVFSNAVIVTFNWFNPTGIMDYINLGRRLLQPELVPMSSEYDNVDIGDIYKQIAETFMEAKEMKSLLERVRNGRKKVILTGFSLGGAICFAIAPLIEKRLMSIRYTLPTRIRAVCFGVPKLGNGGLVHFFKERLHPHSASYVLSTRPDKNSSSLGSPTALFEGCVPVKPIDVYPGAYPSHHDPRETSISSASSRDDPKSPITEKSQRRTTNVFDSLICSNIPTGDFRAGHMDQSAGCLPVEAQCTELFADRPNGLMSKEIEGELMYDPVCIAHGRNTKGLEDQDLLDQEASHFSTANPFTRIILREASVHRPALPCDLERWQQMDESGEFVVKNQSVVKTIANFVLHGSPFSSTYHKAFSELHSVSAYYTAMLGSEFVTPVDPFR